MAKDWRFLTNHARVLLAIASDPTIRIRELAHRVGITERAVQHVLRDLREDGYITVRREGRRSVYAVDRTKPLRSAVVRTRTVDELLGLLAELGEETNAQG